MSATDIGGPAGKSILLISQRVNVTQPELTMNEMNRKEALLTPRV